MPLTLLSKKSWNVYAPDNIARVKRDQAEAQAREEEEDRQSQEQDRAARLALLRGDAPTVIHREQASLEVEERTERDRDPGDSHERRKKRRINGEDDTDRDLRLAREDLESRHKPPEKRHATDKQRRIADAPITDRAGHINLFPDQGQRSAKDHKNAEVEKEKARKERELEDQYTMRFSNAAGKGLSANVPWYAAGKQRKRADMEVVEGRDVWGRPDPAAKGREQNRQVSNDPLAFMQKAQSQLKQSKWDRQRWQEEEQEKTSNLSRNETRDRDHKRRERDRSRDKRREDKKHHRYYNSLPDGQRSARKHPDPSRHNERRRSRSPDRKHRSRHHEPRGDRLPKVSDDFKLDA